MQNNISLLLLSYSSSRLNSMEDVFVEERQISITRNLIPHASAANSATDNSAYDIVILDLSEHWQEDIRNYSSTGTAKSNTPLLVIGENEDTAMMRGAMQAGARDFFYSPIEPDELISAVTHIGSEKKSKKREHNGQISILINGKGGSGSTSLTAGLAASLGRNKKRSETCVVVDLDLQFGTLPIYFDMSRADNLEQALHSASSLDSIALQGLLHHYNDAKVDVLASQPDGLSENSRFPPENIQTLLFLLASTYDHVIVDMPRILDPIGLSAIESADTIFLITQQSVPHIRDTRYLFSLLKSLGISNDTFKLIINRFDKSNKVSTKDVIGAFSDIKSFIVPNDYKRASFSANNGIPVPVKWPNCSISNSLNDLVDQQWPLSKEKNKSSLKRLFG